MLFTVSTKPVLSVVFSNIGSTKNVTAFGFGQNTQINLITCKITNSEGSLLIIPRLQRLHFVHSDRMSHNLIRLWKLIERNG